MAILVSFLDGNATRAAMVDRFPDCCPWCDQRRSPRFIAATVRTGGVRQICFQCTNDGCRALFVASYREETAVNCRLGG